MLEGYTHFKARVRGLSLFRCGTQPKCNNFDMLTRSPCYSSSSNISADHHKLKADAKSQGTF